MFRKRLDEIADCWCTSQKRIRSTELDFLRRQTEVDGKHDEGAARLVVELVNCEFGGVEVMIQRLYVNYFIVH